MEMHCINVVLTALNEADVPELGELLAEQGRLSRAEPGCLRFEVYHSQSNPLVFLLVERWETLAAWEVHREGRAVKEIYVPKVLPRVERVPHISTLLE